MGTIVDRGDKHRAVVRIAGRKPQTKTFDTKKEAKEWISATETELRKGKGDAAFTRQALTLGGVMLKHRDDILANKPYAVNLHDNTRMGAQFADVDLSDMTHEWWIATVQGWKVKPASAQRYVGSILSALHAAEDLKWGVTVNWTGYQEARKAFKRQRLALAGRPRTRRISDDELRAIKAEHSEAEIPLADIIDFAVATAMRVGEICRITWADFDAKRKMQWIRDRKHPTEKEGNDKEIPLLAPRGKWAAMRDPMTIIQRQPRTDARIFPWQPRSLGKAFTLAAKIARVQGVHFHDLRHEGITRLFEQKFGIEQVALVSGHESWETLRDYTHLAAESLHDEQQRAAA